jgi:predicted Holliday junction resolvase-like endonuclease
VLVALCVVGILCTLILCLSACRNIDENKRLKKDLAELMRQIPKAGSTVPMSHFREVVDEKTKLIDEMCYHLTETEKALADLKSQQQSKSVRLGQLTEQILPLHIQFPYDFKLLRPMFQPVDYVYFGEDKIVFIEIKMGTSQLSQKQKDIRRLVEEGKVYFEEHRVAEQGYTVK